mmetsp:Transcript_681/g.1100  ORF Transcript_681/g.1100 Transcript_681/m.1100 type:complete len:167 (-) Transcript_681:470-970(-)
MTNIPPKPKHIKKFNFNLLCILTCLLCHSSIAIIQATNVKWTPNTETNTEAAHTAPRSQKYWDENNIKRPEYGYTDAEIAARQGKTTTTFASFGWVVVVLVLCCYFVHQFMNNNDGASHRLGTNGEDGDNKLLLFLNRFKGESKEVEEARVEEARKARLARFEKVD